MIPDRQFFHTMQRRAATIDEDAEAMARRDEATKLGARICPDCKGVGLVEDADWNAIRCQTCSGETWLDKDGKPYQID